MLHLLKWELQPGRRAPSRRRSIENSRQEIQVILADSPSLKTRIPELMASEYPRAVRLTVSETGQAAQTFAGRCPYTREQLQDENWLPG